jgi:hypothetical protein
MDELNEEYIGLQNFDRKTLRKEITYADILADEKVEKTDLPEIG